MKLAAILACALVSGCYRPGSEVSCTVQCNAENPCEGALSCVLGLCRTPGDVCSDAGALDSALVDAPIPANCWGAAPHQFCQTPAPTGVLEIAAYTMINTDSYPQCLVLPGNPYCVLAFESIVIRARVEGVGSKPLMLVATNNLTIDSTGEVDVSAGGFATGGAGAGGSGCTAGTDGTAGTSSSGGGAGGTFAGLGGAGGVADVSMGGQPGATVTPSPSSVRGGCGGSHGGSNGSGAPGAGGGAVVLIAGNTLTVRGNVLARGAPGTGGALASGGGGGGSGGLIVLDGATVVVSSALIAGGGGGGGGGSSDGPALRGGVSPLSGGPALGGSGAALGGGASGGTGGDGSGGAVMPLDGARGSAGGTLTGGGGGGGGAGAIQIRGMFSNQGATIVPPRT